MKTKMFLLLCLLIGIGFSPLFAQSDKEGKTYSEWLNTAWSDPVYCDGELVDMLDCTLTMHHVAKFVKGEWLHCYAQSHGTAVSQNTGETFTIKEIGKQDNNIQPNGDWLAVADFHFNARGDKGTHYIVFVTMYWDGRITSNKSVCHQN